MARARASAALDRIAAVIAQPPTHLYDLLRRRAKRFPHATALGGQQGLLWRTIDSLELLGLVDRLAAELAAEGVGPGDRVVTWLPNHWQAPVYFWACWRLGAIVVPFDREMNPEAAGRIIASVEPRRVLTGYGQPPDWAPPDRTIEWWPPGARGGASADPSWSRPAEDLATIVFTSGTTGVPKGCMITHRNLISQVEGASELIPLDPACRLASVLPLSHLFELTAGLLCPMAMGAAVHYVPSRRGPDVLRVLSEQRITHMVVVPQLLTILGQAIDNQLRERLGPGLHRALHAASSRLSTRARRILFWPAHRKLGGHLAMVAAGGAALPIDTQRLWERMGVRVIQGYGTSECSPIVAGGRPDGSTPAGSVGRPLRGVEVRLDSNGELLVRGPNVMRGYWKDPERTAEVMRDGWYATGDLGRIDSRGNIFLAGRARDLIVLPSGLNVWPQDVEDVLREDPAVRDAAIVAVPTRSGGMVLHAYLVPERGTGDAAEITGIVARANGRLAQHQRIATASWWPEADFPRTNTLKVRRHLLPTPDTARTVTVDAVAASDDPVGQAISGVLRVAAARDEQTLAELGIDSLAMLDLALALEEKTGKRVAEGDLTPEMTVGQVRARMARAPALGVGADSTSRPIRERVSATQPLWPYTWGQAFRALRWPVTLVYRHYVTRTIVLGEEHLAGLPRRVILAGTHHAYADFPLLYEALAKTPARRLATSMVVAARANAFDQAGLAGWLGILALGLYPLRQYGEQDVSLRGLARLAERGCPVLIFPQGRHVEPEVERRGEREARFRSGVGHLAAALGAVVVPFGQAGTEKVFPNVERSWIMIGDMPVVLRKGPLAIAFGPPLSLEPGESPARFTRRLQTVCFDLARKAEQALEA